MGLIELSSKFLSALKLRLNPKNRKRNAYVYKEDQPSMDNLPEDVLTNIFIRIPARQVAQLRCVSKPLNALLSRPAFVTSHLDHSVRNNKDEILIVFGSPFYFDNRKSFTAHLSHSPHQQCTNLIKIPVNARLRSALFRVIGSVNGLICFFYDVIYIWNPSLSVLLPLPPATNSSWYCSVLLRFGFDPKTDDYKVVKLTYSLKGEMRELFYTCICSFENWLQVEVYSMRKGSWESITQSFPSHIKRIYNQNEVFVDGRDGHLHWLCGFGEERKLQTIVAFDLGVETFCEIPLPCSLQAYIEKCSIVLGLMAGKLCVMSQVRDGECEVWVMDEYGVSESWIKHHVFPQHFGIRRPFGFTSNNVFVFEASDGGLALYYPLEAKVKSFGIEANPTIFDRTKIVPYIDSLVWVAPRKHGVNISLVQSKSKAWMKGKS